MVQAAKTTIAALKGARERDLARRYDAMVAVPFPGNIVAPRVPDAEHRHPRTPSPGPPDGDSSWLAPVGNGGTVLELIQAIGESDCPRWMAEAGRAWGQLRATVFTESDEETDAVAGKGKGKTKSGGASSSSSSASPIPYM